MLTSNFKKSGVDETIGLGGLEVTWVGAVGGVFAMGHTQQESLGPLTQTGSLAVQ